MRKGILTCSLEGQLVDQVLFLQRTLRPFSHRTHTLHRFITYLCLAATTLLSHCKQPSELSQLKITGGVRTEDFPHVVYLKIFYFDGSQASCSGTIVRRRRVLTAAHCLDPLAKRIFIETSMGHSWLARDWRRHPDYENAARDVPTVAAKPGEDRSVTGSANLDNVDVGVIQTSIDMVKAANLKGIPKIRSRQPARDSKVVIVGFGLTEKADPSTNELDEKHYGCNTIDHVADGHFFIKGRSKTFSQTSQTDPATWDCGNKDGRGERAGEDAVPSQGDSGGPAFQNGYLLGVAVGEEGKPRKSTHHGGVYTHFGLKITRDFIDKHIGQRDAPTLAIGLNVGR